MYAAIALRERIRHYFLISFSLSFITGLTAQRFVPISAETATATAAIFLVTALVFHRKNSSLTILFLLPAILSLGALHSVNYTRLKANTTDISRKIIQEEDAVLIGTLHRMVLFDGEQSTLIVKSHALRLRHENHFSSTKGLVRLRLKDRWPEHLVPGDELVFRVTLSRPYRFGNPGGFDYPAHLASQNIRVIGRINSIVHISPLQQDASWIQDTAYCTENIRTRIKDFLDQNLSSQESGIYKALLIGDRSGLDQETLEGFKASGTMHILAISGLHLSLIASLLFLLFYFLAKRSEYLMLRISCKKLALLASVIPLCLYALLAGAQTPVIRSLIMVIVFIFSFCINRQSSPFTTLSLAALIILFINPLSLFTISFQLSFAAVAALILLFPRFSRLVQSQDSSAGSKITAILMRLGRWIMAALLVSLTAIAGTAPLLLAGFNRISIVSPVANLLIEPLLCLWSLPFGLLATGIYFFDPHTAYYFLQAGAIGIKAAIHITHFFAQYDCSTVWLPTPAPFLILFYYVSLMFCFSQYSLKKTLPLFVTIIVLFFYPPQHLLQRFSTASEIVFLDVGQGTSTLIQFPGGKNVLVDGGGALSKRFNVGESVIAKYLWHRGIIRLDAIVITHPDADHYNGIPFLLKQFRPDILWVNGESGHGGKYEKLLNLARTLGTKVSIPQANEIIMVTNSLTLLNIRNPLIHDKTPPDYSVNSNDKSLILHMMANNLSCLLTGDISARVENALLKEKTNLQSSILLSAHHGSKTSNSSKFIDAVSPDYIVVSSGRFKPLLFPSTQLRALSMEKQIPLLITSQKGAISFRQNDGSMEYATFF